MRRLAAARKPVRAAPEAQQAQMQKPQQPQQQARKSQQQQALKPTSTASVTLTVVPQASDSWRGGKAREV